MESFQDANYFPLPSQGNVYTTVNLALANGTYKVLVGILKRKVFCCEFISNDDGTLVPSVKEVPFTCIPAGAEILSMDAFNKSSDRDNFFIGISIIKVTSEQNIETYLNVYTEQDSDEKESLNLDNIAQNCLMLELTFTPYQLTHTYVIDEQYSKEVVWLLSGSDMKVHLYREDPQNHMYGETDIQDVFPEFDHLPSIILWMDVKHTPDFRTRITAFGCECGITKLFMMDSITGNKLREFIEYYDAPVSRVQLFSLNKSLETTNLELIAGSKGAHKLEIVEDGKVPMHLLVVNTLRPSAVFLDVVENGLKTKLLLPGSEKFDAALTSCLADINLDGKPEIIIGTYAAMILVYQFNEKWKLMSKRRLSHAVHSVKYIDLSGDGIKELIVTTASGVHILLHKPDDVIKTFKKRMGPFLKILNPERETGEPTKQSK